MHPYRSSPVRVVDDDADVRAYAAQTQSPRKRARAAIIVIGVVLAFAMLDWTATAEILCGRAVAGLLSRW